jgi:hypothetical protein
MNIDSKEMQSIIDGFSKELNTDYDDMGNTVKWVVTKMAAMELRLRKLESAKGRSDDFLSRNTPLM